MRKGQSSFETIMVTLVVIVTSTFILGAFFDLGDQTFALATIKANAMQEIDKNETFYVIKKIYYVQSDESTIEFDVIVVDDTISQTPATYLNMNSAAEKIVNKTKYSNLTIRVSGNQVYP
ncbi:MAG: hypothetical protein ABH986_01720 [archaeon]